MAALRALLLLAAASAMPTLISELPDIDEDEDGISYEEFVDKLARGTVSNAAMGKRGMQSKEAMGVDSQEMLAKQLGHGDKKYFNPSINA